MSATIAVWGVTYLLHSTLLIGIVWLAVLRIRSASVRDTLWKVALVGGIVTASAQTLVPVERSAPVRMTFDRDAFERVAPVIAESDVFIRGEVGDKTDSALSQEAVLFSVWGLVALLLLARIAVGHGRFLRAVGDRVEVVTGPERARLDALCRRAGVRRLVRLTASESLVSPVAMLRWEIVIPAGVFARLSEDQRDTILAHELGHLLRRDPLWLTAGEVIKAVLFFQPLNWLVQAKSKETAEFLCDDAAVLQTGRPKALAETLAELASHPAPAPPAVAAMAEGGSNLMVRVTRVLQSDPVAPVRLAVRLGLAVAVLSVTVVFAPGMVAGVVKAYDTDKVNFVSDATLSQTFEGPDGHTHVELEAHEAEIAKDGSYVRFAKKSGFLRATQTSERGSKREVDVAPGRDGEPKYTYRVDGIEKPWCDDARLVILAAFRSEKAYREALREQERVPPRSTRTGRHDWGATVELTGTRDGIPTYLSVKAKGISIDYDTGEVDVQSGGFVEVVERDGSLERTFRLDERSKGYGGALEHDEKAPWLSAILRKQTALPEKVIDTIAR